MKIHIPAKAPVVALLITALFTFSSLAAGLSGVVEVGKSYSIALSGAPTAIRIVTVVSFGSDGWVRVRAAGTLLPDGASEAPGDYWLNFSHVVTVREWTPQK